MIELSQEGDSSFLKMPRSIKTGEAKWKDIEDLINRWAKRNPQAAIDLENYIKETKAGMADKNMGKTKGALGRMGLAIHPQLMQYIQAFYPDFMDTKEDMHEFMRRFKKFTIPEAV